MDILLAAIATLWQNDPGYSDSILKRPDEVVG